MNNENVSIVRQCHSADSVVYLLKVLMQNLSRLEDCIQLGQLHPTITKDTLEADMTVVLDTLLYNKIIAKVTAEMEYQLTEWYRGKFQYSTCNLMYFNSLLLSICKRHPDNVRKLRTFLKTPLKKSMVSAFENFADLHYDEEDVELVRKRNVHIFKLVHKIDARISNLNFLINKHEELFKLNAVFNEENK